MLNARSYSSIQNVPERLKNITREREGGERAREKGRDRAYLGDFWFCRAFSSASPSTLSRNRECFIHRPRGRVFTNDTTSEISVDVETARDGNWPTAIEPIDARGVCAGESSSIPALSANWYLRYRHIYCAPSIALTTMITLLNNIAIMCTIVIRRVTAGVIILGIIALLVRGAITFVPLPCTDSNLP